jgi:predicted secreted hydrolase
MKNLVIILIAALTSYSALATEQTQQRFTGLMAKDNSGFERALEVREFKFPADHGPHNTFRTEWWYFTGNLQNPYGQKFGYELTFFRFALSPNQLVSKSAWRDNQLYMAHLTVTDVAQQKFYVSERFSRAGNGLAGAASNNFHVWLQDWSVTAQDTGFPLHLKAQSENFSIDLLLKTDQEPILQGNQGLSQKSPEPGNASYYYSYPLLLTEGNININDQHFSVIGSSWMDREWSTSSLSEQQSGWDWFALQLNDNSKIMFYRLRRKDGQLDPNSSGSAILADNSKQTLANQDVQIKVTEEWTSPHSKVTYPSGWQLSIPSQQLELDIKPLLKDQELNVSYRYWEGAVSMIGTKQGKPIKGVGYVELAGYK